MCVFVNHAGTAATSGEVLARDTKALLQRHGRQLRSVLARLHAIRASAESSGLLVPELMAAIADEAEASRQVTRQEAAQKPC